MPLPGVVRRVLRPAVWRARRWRNRLLRLRRATVRQVDPETVAVSRGSGLGWRRRRLDSELPYRVVPASLRIELPDPAALARLAATGLLYGKIRGLRVRLASFPDWLAMGQHPVRVDRSVETVSWRRRGRRIEVRFQWTNPVDVHRALAAALGALLRARIWDQASGPVYALDRAAWLDGVSSWPQGQLAAAPPEVEVDAAGRPLGPYQLPPKSSTSEQSIVGLIANPYGRRLVGAAIRYRLTGGGGRWAVRDESGRVALRLDQRTSADAVALGGGVEKYGVVSVESPVPPDGYLADALRALAGCGLVFAAPDVSVRSSLESLGVVVVVDPKEVNDLRGYALSVAAARRIAVTRDAALRRTPLGGGDLPLPAVSVVLSSMRPDHIDACLRYLADQTYPALEVVVGLHGYQVPERTREQWRELLPCRLRVAAFPAELTFGMVLGRLSRIADGELITKVDDDDHYGANHITDLVIAWHTSGAEVAAKGGRFVHFPELSETIDRVWTAHEVFNVTPAGGTLLLARSALQQVGGWSHSPRHVDTDLLTRVKSAGGVVFRSHGLEYVYVRRTTGHTWANEIEEFTAQGERVYPGLPDEIIRPDYSFGG